MSNNLFIIVGIVALAILIYFLVSSCNSNNKNIETWVNYQQLPFGNYYTGAGDLYGNTPFVAYEVERYRRPLNWPVCHLVDYPVPHCKHDP